MAIESAALKIGSAIAQTAAKIWLRSRSSAEERSMTLVQLTGARGLGILPQRRLNRQLDQLAETIAQRLEPLCDQEFRRLAEHDRLAALDAVALTLETADLSDSRLLQVAVSAPEVEQLAAPAATAVLAKAELGEAGEQFYRVVLREAIAHLTEVIVTLPSFQNRALREILERETEIIDLLRGIFDRMPEREVLKTADASGEFELEYRREVARKLDQVELFGVTTSRPTRRYPLSVAYIGLMASAHDLSDGLDEDETVEATLSGSFRTVIRGEAGSGKTTLLRWLAVRAAQHKLESALSSWNGLVPFFVQLRRHAGRKMPGVVQLPVETAWTLRDRMPPSWAFDVLRAGRGLVLIDGVDEIPLHQRDEVREWLSDLVGAFPTSRYVVTSRPPAIADDWLEDCGFAATDLQPMSRSHVRSFIQHWHEAVGADFLPEDRADLRRYQGSLLAGIDGNQALRSLATNPLLCALLCALNHDRRAQLPHSRMELYRTALEMLLYRRDTERRVPDAELTGLSPAEQMLALEDLAYWFTINQLTNAESDRVVRRLGTTVRGFSGPAQDPHEVYTHLLLRSGLLREHSAGQVDFIHKTFQEYLAAKRIVDTDSIEMLARRATDDSYHEVIVLAVGHARQRERELLLEQILLQENRPGITAPQRKQLRGLAVSCLETATQLSPSLRQRIVSCFSEFIPPKSPADARVLAMAGADVLPLLRKTSSLSESEAAASVHAAALVRGRSALPTLAALARDTRPAVLRELVRSWTYFDPVEYARVVLAPAPLGSSDVTISDPAVLPGVEHLPSGRRLNFDFTGPLSAADLRAIGAAKTVTSLRLTNEPMLESLDFLAEHPTLREVAISHAAALRDVSALPTLRQLVSLSITSCPQVSAVEDILSCQRLRKLSTSRVVARDARKMVERLPALRWLDLRSCSSLMTIGDLGANPALRRLGFDACGELSGLDGLAGFPGLVSLSFLDCPLLRISGPELADSAIESLTLRWCDTVRNLEPLCAMPNLRRLHLQGLGIPDLGPLRELTKLTSLAVLDCPWVNDLRPLADLPALRHLSLQRTGTRLDLGQLGPKEDLAIEHSGNAYNTKGLGVSTTVSIAKADRVPE
ncbi:NACHT domain-containing protein [Amycolatopsis sp. GA6-003]|uniref:NACHT N-terminal Helical domain 1-containing protein n=1 Tax=Amycolatopsis sp. GA6-003 TaxID=2652444 RepID=UPI0039175E43